MLSVKTVTNRVENATGQEDRFGRRDQIIEFYPVYQFNLAGNGGTQLQANQTIKGVTTKTTGTIARVNGNVVYVRVKTSQFFQKRRNSNFRKSIRSYKCYCRFKSITSICIY